MKKAALACIFLAWKISVAQVSGNANYQSQVRYPDSNIEISVPVNSNVSIIVKDLANLKADNYVAIFSVAQVGKTTEEVNTLIDTRINQSLAALKSLQGLETFVDMISFVPAYEFETDKKLFSKRTYNEIPNGFELKKNIHVKYKDPNQLNQIIATLSASEIYDLVRVDYFSDKIGETKLDLVNKSRILLLDKMKTYKQLLGAKIDSSEKRMAEGFRIVYPVEMYKSYQAYANSDLNLRKSATVNQVEKSTTLYYQPVIDKEFDFVINPTILEPVIQVMYEVRMEINREKEVSISSKEYYMITPGGDLKRMDLKN